MHVALFYHLECGFSRLNVSRIQRWFEQAWPCRLLSLLQ